METEHTDYQSVEYLDYSDLGPQSYFATPLQLFAVIVYLLSHSFEIPILPVGPSWAVWPRLDDFATLFLFMVYLGTRNNTCPMDKNERLISRLIVIGIIFTIPSILLGQLMNPGAAKGMTFGIAHTYRVAEYFLVWFCIRGMVFSSKQFDKISYAIFFITIFVVIISIGNITGKIPIAKLVAHLPYGAVSGRFILLHEKTGPSLAMGPYAGSLTMRMTLFTMLLLVSRKPSAIFRIPLIVIIGGVIFFGAARAGMIGWALAIAFFSCKSIKQLVIVILMILLFYILAVAFSEVIDIEVMERAQSDVRSIVGQEDINVKLSGRVERWSMILRYIVSHPQVLIWGVGWGFTGQIFGGNAHSMYLHMLCEVGLFGLVMFLFLLSIIWRLLRGKDRLLGAMRAAFLAYLITSFTGEVFYPTASSGSFLGCLGAIFAIAVATYRGRLLEEQYNEEYEFLEEYPY